MKIALAHDYLNQWGGAERVLETLSEMFPKAPIYTLFYDKDKILGKFSGRVKQTSFLDFPLVHKWHRFFIPLMPLASNSLFIDKEYDVIISDSAGYAKGIKYEDDGRKCPLHISYCHTPLRYAWEPEYVSSKFSAYGGPAAGGKTQKLISFGTKPLLSYLRKWDYAAGQKPDILIANSNYIADKIKKYYGREVKVIYPPVDLKVFHPDKKKVKKNYFLAAGRFMHYKRFDLIIKAFNKLELPLKVLGYGPEERTLKTLAWNPKIEFIPFKKDLADLRKIYSHARALIFPQIEDFGLVAAEAIACGTPVIAFNDGGAKEIVNRNSGILFEEQSVESLSEAVKKFIAREKKFLPVKVAKEAKKFSKENFVREIHSLIKTPKFIDI